MTIRKYNRAFWHGDPFISFRRNQCYCSKPTCGATKPRTTGFSVFYRDQCTYNPQFSKGEPYGNKSGSVHAFTEAGETTYGKFGSGPGTRNDNPGIRYPKQCIEFGVVERDTLHPTQKPVDLLRYLVLTYTNEGDTVLDNCMGSGTTAIACIKERRHFIGFELSKEYFDKAVKRIKAEQAQLTLF